MAFLHDIVLDNGLSVLAANVNAIHICSQEPTTYTEATSTHTLGNKTTPTMSSVQDRTGGGREVEAASFSDGSVTANGTATHYAWVNTTTTTLLVTEALTSSQVVTNGNSFSLTAHAAGIPDPA